MLQHISSIIQCVTLGINCQWRMFKTHYCSAAVVLLKIMNQIRYDKLQLFWRYLGQYFHSFIFIDLCVKDIKLLQVKYRQAPANISLIKAILLFRHVLLPILGQIALAFLCVISHCQIIVRIKPITPFLNKRLNYLKMKDPLWYLNI